MGQLSFRVGFLSRSSIYYKVTFMFFVIKKDTVGVVISATHSTFPDFEGGVDGQFPVCFPHHGYGTDLHEPLLE